MANTTTSSTKLPSYLENPIKSSLGSIEDFLNSDANYVYGSKPGETLYTPLSDLQKESIGNAEWLGNQDLAQMFGINQAGDWLTQYADYSPDQLSSEKVTDQNGYLGDISGYVNPYIDQVLNPQIRNIEDATQRRLNDLGASSAMSGSFGDARHGINESLVYQDANKAIGDATGQAYADAWNNAMSLRQGDLATKLGVDTSNRDAETAANANKATAASGMAGLGNQYFNLFTDVNDTLFNAGDVERQAEIEKNQALRDFQTAIKDKKYNDALKLLAAATGAPGSTTSTSEQKSNDGLWGLLGSALGSIF